MDGYKTSAELKADAKDMLSGRWKEAVLMNLLPSLLIFVAIISVFIIIFFLIESFGSVGTGYGNAPMGDDGGGGGGGGGAGGLFTTLINTGISYAFLDAYRSNTYEIRPLKDAFQVFSKKYFLPVLFVYILTTIFTFLWALLFVIPGIIKSIAYSQAYLIYKDHVDRPQPEHISALDTITESRMLMDGHKMRYFMLQLSFLGWILVGALTLGIGFLWINPYINATNVAFYNDLIDAPVVEDESYWNESAQTMDRPFGEPSPDQEEDFDDLDF